MGDSTWVQPSGFTTVVFVAIVAAVAAMFVWGIRAAGRRQGEASEATTRWTLGAVFGLAVYMGVTGAASGLGLLEASLPVPPLMLFFAACNATVVVLAFSPVGSRLVRALPVVAFVAPQALRLPLELVLHQWSAEGVIPVQMTFEGHNFDIVTGVFALVVAAVALRGEPPRRLVLAFNVVGLGLLLTVATIAVLSSPLPVRAYDGPPLLLALHFPFGWIVPMCVSAALFGHLLTFRWLWKTRGAARLKAAAT